MSVITRVIGKLSIKKKINGGCTCDRKIEYLFGSKMNNSSPIIKIFLFPYTERTERIFLPILPSFLFCPHTKILDTPKWFSDCESVNSVASINILRDYYSGAKTGKKKKLSKGLKK